MNFPGEVHQHLLERKIVNHPKIFRNENRDSGWVSLQTHTYSTEFFITAEHAFKATVLKLDQVGVVANISINGVQVGFTDNVYRTYFFKVPKNLLNLGSNTIKIVIQSTVRYTYIQGAKFTPHESWNEYQWGHVWL